MYWNWIIWSWVILADRSWRGCMNGPSPGSWCVVACLLPMHSWTVHEPLLWTSCCCLTATRWSAAPMCARCNKHVDIPWSREEGVSSINSVGHADREPFCGIEEWYAFYSLHQGTLEPKRQRCEIQIRLDGSNVEVVVSKAISCKVSAVCRIELLNAAIKAYYVNDWRHSVVQHQNPLGWSSSTNSKVQKP